MKLILSLLALFTLAASALAADPRGSNYFDGTVTRDLTSALARAKTENRPVVLVTYDPNNKQMTSDYTIGGFFKMPETRKLLKENFIQVFTPWTTGGVAQYRDMQDKTDLPTAIFIKPDGTLLTRVRFQYGPAQALEQVQAVVAKLPRS